MSFDHSVFRIDSCSRQSFSSALDLKETVNVDCSFACHVGGPFYQSKCKKETSHVLCIFLFIVSIINLAL